MSACSVITVILVFCSFVVLFVYSRPRVMSVVIIIVVVIIINDHINITVTMLPKIADLSSAYVHYNLLQLMGT